VQPRPLAWLDLPVAICALGGLTASVLYQVQMHVSSFAASDFKTLYASLWCFTHRMNAYDFANLQKVFVANGVVQPEKWFGHAPVYPWTTLALLSPLSALGMVPAAYVLVILSAVILAIAVAGLMRYAAASFNMGPVWRVAIAGLCASGPLLGFGMDLGNLSVTASALCFLAFVRRKHGTPFQSGSRWIPSAALAMAFLLKPHLALWAGVGMLLLPERATRSMVMRAIALVAGFTALTAGVMAAMGTLGFETHAYLAMLAAETSAGASMNAASREVLPVVSQITSLDSIVGFWVTNPALRVLLTCAMLLGIGLLAIRQTRRVDTERGALLAVGMWCTLGMLATYHRAHDAVLLLLLVPWAVDRVRRTPLAWHAWAAAALYFAMSVSLNFPVVVRWVAAAPEHSMTAFVLLRQVGLADALLLVVLLLAMKREQAHDRVRSTQQADADELQAAA
jgi:hypothetical protein